LRFLLLREASGDETAFIAHEYGFQLVVDILWLLVDRGSLLTVGSIEV
jgi:hypothetical protein